MAACLGLVGSIMGAVLLIGVDGGSEDQRGASSRATAVEGTSVCTSPRGDVITRSGGREISGEIGPAGIDLREVRVTVDDDVLRIDAELEAPFGEGVTMAPGTVVLLIVHIFGEGAEERPLDNLLYSASAERIWPIDEPTARDRLELNDWTTFDQADGTDAAVIDDARTRLEGSGFHAEVPLTSLPDLPAAFSYDAQASASHLAAEVQWADGCPAPSPGGGFLVGVPLPQFPSPTSAPATSDPAPTDPEGSSSTIASRAPTRPPGTDQVNDYPRAAALLRRMGWLAEGGTAAGFDPPEPLAAIAALEAISASGRGTTVFFFRGNELVGKDSELPSQISQVTEADGDTVTVEYSIYLPLDPGCCPSGGTVAVRFTWNGSEVVPLDPLPLTDESGPHR